MGALCYIDSDGQRKCFWERERKEKIDDNIEINTSEHSVTYKEYNNQSINPNEKPIKTKTKKTIRKINLKNQKLKDFLNKMNIQGLKDDDINDNPYNALKNLEQEELKKVIETKQEELENEIYKIFNFKIIKEPDIDIIIKNEFTDSVFKKKISIIAQEIEKDKEKYSFKNLKIMLVGRKGIGKTDLINYIFESEENVKKRHFGDLCEYTCEKYPFLKFVEYRGIGFDHNSNPELIGTNICTYIKNLQSQNYNEFIHCIWYCITETKFEAPEIAVLKKLKSSYQNDNILPIIAVYTKTESHEEANLMEQHIKNQNIDTLFIKTLAKSYEMPNGKIQETFGRKELLDATLDKCTKSLQGDLINLMTKNISNEIQNEMKNNNKKILKNIKEKIVDKFTNEFVQVKEDGDLIDYIINIIIDNLFDFYDIKITNKSFNFLNNSEFINDIKNNVKNYKSNVKQMIKPIVEEKAKILLDEQAKIEIEKGNMLIKNKRNLKEFKRTIAIFLKKNFYYISQRLMISVLLDNIYNVFFEDYVKKLNKKIDNIMNIKNNNDIRILLANTFLTKLKDFGENWDIKIEIKKIECDNLNLPEQRDIENDDEKQNNNKLITNSFNFIPDENIIEKEINENNNLDNEFVENKNWFPFERNKKWKYIKDKSSLDKFLQNLIYQDSYFNIETDDQIFISLRDYIKNSLINFLNKKKLEYIRNIEQIYFKKKFPFEKIIIPKIIEKENIPSIYDKKIKNEIDIINNNINEIKLDYITIFVMGRSGLGKSELINSLLKDTKAEVGVGFRVTLFNTVYRGDNNLSFLRLIDTRGTELDEKIGLEKIKKNAFDMIDKMKQDATKTNDYNKNIQCIYYCVKGATLEESEIKTIKEIKNNNDSIPLIVLFTKGINKNDIDSMRNLITTRLKVPFISLLAKEMNGQERYGLNDLLKLTLNECQKAKKGSIFKAIEEKICNKVEINLKKVNESIKLKIGNDMEQKLNNFQNVVDENELFRVIYSYIEIAFVEYMKYEQNENENFLLKEESLNELKNAILINDYIKEFIECYKKKSNEMVEPSLENGSLEFLDMQVRKEKKLSKSIEVENKNNRESFKKIIRNFLNSNFYYISQKYLIYRFLLDFSEPFSEEFEKNVNSIVKEHLQKNSTKELIKISFDKIFNAFRQTIFQNTKNGNIYEEKENENDNNCNNSFNNNFNNNNYPIELNSQKSGNKDDLECPYPYPSF